MPTESSGTTLRLWAFGDGHVGTDKRYGRESLSKALRQSESGGTEGGPPFAWDLAINVGDLSGAEVVPQDAAGEEVVHHLQVLRHHKREAIYDVCGNVDRSGLDEPDACCWQKWVDPLGQHTQFAGVHASRRPYPIDGTWERYAFRVKNILSLIMSDRNGPSQKVGRGTLGWNPGGVVRGETFAWWQQMAEANPKSLIISVRHDALKDTTVASGAWEGMRQDDQGNWQSHYHRCWDQGTPQGASSLYWVDGTPDAQAFEQYLAEHPGAVQLWLGGHTQPNPDDTYGGKSHIEQKWGTHFVNICALTQYHAGRTTVPMSRLFTFVDVSPDVYVQGYVHTSQYAPQGWYPKAEKTWHLSKPFRW